MAGFFGLFDYTKEGPGVPKDAPPKPRFIIFFEVLGRKFWNIVKVNLLYLLFNIPAFIFFLFFAMYYLDLLMQVGVFEIQTDEIVLYLIGIIIPLFLPFVCFPLIAVGPAQAGMTYVQRNYSREEHAFIWSDFIEHAKKNFKQSMIVGFINCVVTVLTLIDIYIYFNMKNTNTLLSVASALIIMAFVLFIMMSMYIYPMMVTFKLTVRQLYKNAFLFAIMKFLPNLLIIIACLAVIILPFYFYPVLGYILMFFITFGLISYITNFYVYSKMDKYMIQPVLNKGKNTEEPDRSEPEKTEEITDGKDEEKE
jgi:uncharacterized membrane protein YesL